MHRIASSSMRLQSVMRRGIQLLLMLAGIVCSFSALAAYTFKIVQYPGAGLTQLWGINDSGHVLGQAWQDADGTMPIGNFIYDLTTGAFTLLSPVPSDISLLGINNAGETVGSKTDDNAPEAGEIRFANGVFASPVLHAMPLENTEFRAVNKSGLVTGFAYDDTGDNSIGFIYDPAHASWIDFLPSEVQTIAQGINTKGQVVGNTYLFEGMAYPGSPEGQYGFLRASSGVITFFQVNGVCTRARGINDSGQITGWTRPCSPGTHASGFVGSFPGPSFQSLSAPGASDTIPQAIDNAGRIVGAADGDGFIASSNKDDCKKGGWQSLSRADGTFFKNQGDCIQYVNTGK